MGSLLDFNVETQEELDGMIICSGSIPVDEEQVRKFKEILSAARPTKWAEMVTLVAEEQCEILDGADGVIEKEDMSDGYQPRNR